MKFDATRSDFMPYGFSCELWTPTPMPRPDRHNEIELNYLPSGTLTYLLAGRRITVGPGKLVLFWAAIPHQILKWRTKEPYYVATLPLPWFLACGFPDQLTRPLFAGSIVTDPASTPEDEPHFRKWITDVHSSEPLRERAAHLEMQARLMRLALALILRKETSTKETQINNQAHLANYADQIACYIALHYSEPLTVSQIAKTVNLHPNYAIELFKRTFGTTIIDFVVKHRLSHAQRLLVTTSDKIISIAGAAGFQSLSRFNEVFKQLCGCSPREYRKVYNSFELQQDKTKKK